MSSITIPYQLMEKPEQTFWPTQYIIMGIGSVMLVNSEFFFNLEHLRVGRLLCFESGSYFLNKEYSSIIGLPRQLSSKESASNAVDVGSTPRWGRPPGGGNGNLLQYFARKIPWTEEPSRLQSIESQRVTHDRAHTHSTFLNSEYRVWGAHDLQKEIP